MPRKAQPIPLVSDQTTRLWPTFTGIWGIVLPSLISAITTSATAPESTAIALTQAPAGQHQGFHLAWITTCEAATPTKCLTCGVR